MPDHPVSAYLVDTADPAPGFQWKYWLPVIVGSAALHVFLFAFAFAVSLPASESQGDDDEVAITAPDASKNAADGDLSVADPCGEPDVDEVAVTGPVDPNDIIEINGVPATPADVKKLFGEKDADEIAVTGPVDISQITELNGVPATPAQVLQALNGDGNILTTGKRK